MFVIGEHVRIRRIAIAVYQYLPRRSEETINISFRITVLRIRSRTPQCMDKKTTTKQINNDNNNDDMMMMIMMMMIIIIITIVLSWGLTSASSD